MKSDKMPCIIYVGFEYFIKLSDGCENNPEKSSLYKIGKHVPFGCYLWTIWGLDNIENKKIQFKRKKCFHQQKNN